MLASLRAFVAAAIAAGLVAADTLAASQFQAADTNHNGVLDSAEFYEWFSKATDANGSVARVQQPGGDWFDFHAQNDPKGENIPSRYRGAVNQAEQTTLSFWVAFVNSVMMIIVTELGDKTFFIAAILAMRHERAMVFGGAIAALALMTVLSAVIGFALPNILPREYTHILATLLFFYFGVKLLLEAKEMYDKGEGVGPSDELEEVEQSLKGKKDEDIEKKRRAESDDETTPAMNCSTGQKSIFIQTFTLTFLAEWGDRSQIATIALAAAKDPFGVTFGGIVGHSLCTGLAVVGGKLLASRISERSVLLCGGLLFLVFALHSALNGAED